MRQMSSISGLPSDVPFLKIYQPKDEINGVKKQYLRRSIVEIEINKKQESWFMIVYRKEYKIIVRRTGLEENKE